jgi:hypothetical protein
LRRFNCDLKQTNVSGASTERCCTGEKTRFNAAARNLIQNIWAAIKRELGIMAKSNSTVAKMSDEEMAAFQAESAAIWDEARKPDFDWSKVPLTYISSTTNTVAFCRCMGHPDLKQHRTEIAKIVLAQLDLILLAAGFTKDGKTIWRKGVRDAKLPDKPAPETQTLPNAEVEKAEARGGLFSGLRRTIASAFSTPSAGAAAPKTKPSWAATAASKLPNPAHYLSTSVYLEFQRDRGGFCFYINAGIRPGGLNLAHSNKLAAEAAGSIADGYYVFRPVHFTPDLPTTLKPDQFNYMRLKEDPRFMPFMLDLIEKRIIACLTAWADPAILNPPLPNEMAKRAPLQL